MRDPGSRAARELSPEGIARSAAKPIRLGTRVRVADALVLAAALRGPEALRPEPAQMLWSGRAARVTGYRRGPDGRARYLLADAPGLWLEEWIDPI